MKLLITKGEGPISDHLEKEAKSACKQTTSDEDFIDLKNVVSSAQESVEEVET